MAPYALRLRRALTLSSSLVHHSLHRSTPSIPLPTTSPISQNATSSVKPSFLQPPPCRCFTSTTNLLSSRASSSDYNTDEIGPDTILFEGCDYNHWLIVVDFPKDPVPSAEEMVRFYEETAAKVFGSLEEAKKRIYACSTTTYKGFQVECSEQTSEKFQGLPGVIFVLPDSYIDPVNKEYGGDKYINGEIIHRPPPIQYGRQGSRRSRPSPREPMQGRNFGPPRNPPPQQNSGQPYPPPQQNYGPPQNFPPQQNYGPPRNFPPQQNYGPPRNFPPQQNYGPPQNFPPQQNYGPPQNIPPQQNYGPPGAGGNAPGGWNNSQGGQGDPMSSYQPSYNQGHGNQPNYNQGQGSVQSPGQRDFPNADQRSFTGPAPQGGSSGAQQGPGTAYGQHNYPTDPRNGRY